MSKHEMPKHNVAWLNSNLGQTVITQAGEFNDPLVASTKLRSRFPEVDHELIRQAITQSALQAKSTNQDLPKHWLFTDDGLQQGTRSQVAKFRAEFLKSKFGILKILDLTCGLGFDSYFLAKAGHQVRCVERDPEIAQLAQNNLSEFGITVEVRAAENFNIPPDTQLVFIDPARRDPGSAKSITGETKRTMNPQSWSPSWSFVEQVALSHQVVAKVSPGISTDLIQDWDAYWISSEGDLVEAMLISGGTARREAILLNGHEVTKISGGKNSKVSTLGRFLVVPNRALIRASALDYFVDALGAGLVNEHIAWLTTDQSEFSNLAKSSAQVFEILEILKFDEKLIANRISELLPRTLTVMTRGVSVDPDLLRKKLLKQPSKGGKEIVLAIYRDDAGPVALICRRVQQNVNLNK